MKKIVYYLSGLSKDNLIFTYATDKTLAFYQECIIEDNGEVWNLYMLTDRYTVYYSLDKDTPSIKESIDLYVKRNLEK